MPLVPSAWWIVPLCASILFLLGYLSIWLVSRFGKSLRNDVYLVRASFGMTIVGLAGLVLWLIGAAAVWSLAALKDLKVLK